MTLHQGDLLWEPSAAFAERARLTGYMRWLAEERAVEAEGYDALWRWSVSDLEAFWASIWDYFEVEASAPYEGVLSSREMPGARWFTGARLNYAQHIFRDRDPAAVALHHASELKEPGTWTWGELRGQTAAIRAGLQRLGVEEGDRVVAYLPNIPETIAAFLACASLGATWSSAAPEFGTASVVDRFQQIQPKVMLAVDGYRYNGRDYDRRDAVDQIAAQISSLEHVVRLSYLEGRGWDEGFLAEGELEFAQVPVDAPLWVLYSSGTTGLPKAIIHGHGGILLEQLKQLNLHLDAQPGDRVFWFTTTGWMMWNYLVGVLLTPAQIVLYDGSPAFPDLGVLWDLAEETGVTCFGTSAAYLASCIKERVKPLGGRDLSALRSVGVTGSPLAPEGFSWVYSELGADTWLFSMSGGTDVCSSFVGGCPLLAVYRGELQARALGCDVQAFDDSGRALTGQVGELVVTQPMPSMPIGFWDDPAGERLRESYFAMYPGIWRHGDWIEISERGTAVISGRSDSTINRGGIRMGTSEIYRALVDLEEIVDALVVDLAREGAENWMPLFVVLRDHVELDDTLTKEIASRIRSRCSPRHLPDQVIAVPAVPRTLSGKILEAPVKRILMGTPAEEATSRESLASPGALDWFIEFAAKLGASTAPGPLRR